MSRKIIKSTDIWEKVAELVGMDTTRLYRRMVVTLQFGEAVIVETEELASEREDEESE